MRYYTTKTLTRDGITYTAQFRDMGDHGFRVVAFTIAVAGQTIDALKGASSHWTEDEVDSWFIRTLPHLSILADVVYEDGLEISFEEERRAA